jgi:hypothetical protein
MEVTFKFSTGVSKEVNKSSLLNELVFFVKADVLHLCLGVSQVNHLLLFNNISPLVAKLHGFITGVDVIENGEFRTREPSEVTGLD